MKLAEPITLLLLVGFFTSMTACTKEDEDEDEVKDEANYESTMPTIAFSVALKLDEAGLHLAKEDGKLKDRADRINTNVDSVNEDLKRANKEYAFSEPGDITGKGDDGKESGSFSKIDDGTYTRQVVICHDGKVQMLVKWSVDGKKILVERDLNQKPDKPENVKVKTIFDDGTDKMLTAQFYGKPAGTTPDADGNMLAAWDEGKVSAESKVTIRGVSNFFNIGDEGGVDEYLTGTIDANSEGSFVGYSKYATGCNGVTFNETDPTDSWCDSRQINADKWFTPTEAAAAWTDTLKPIGVAPKANLVAPALDAKCPA